MGLFGLITLLVLRWTLPRRQGPVTPLLFYIVTGLVVLSALSEVLQVFTETRTALLTDWLQNLLGIGLALALSPQLLITIPRRWRPVPVFLAIPIVAIVVLPLWILVADTLHARQQFPVLLTLASPHEVTRIGSGAPWEVTPVGDEPGGHVLSIRIPEGGGGIGVRHFPEDWRDYDQLRLRIYAPEAFPLTLRVHDALHEGAEQVYNDRFNRRFELQSGWQTLTVRLEDIAGAPVGRTMDLARIRNIGIFNLNPGAEREFLLSDIRLTRGLSTEP